MHTQNRIQIEEHEYKRFVELYKLEHGPYRHLRFGQALYNHFRFHKMADQRFPNTIYNMKNGRLGPPDSIFQYIELS